ncbi:hypothetical protein ANCCEY_04111 [Ancylostoma ceylanicum]|uniref:Amiloride-sensitive sodium channel n=2 Tax=Ancylostoma ceylanicum TaxID=53326 RepID=A0A0D6LYE3_9BILA|nr:hypothetical protein ANCCEY_04111 [Ancylostoma ceylanicum]
MAGQADGIRKRKDSLSYDSDDSTKKEKEMNHIVDDLEKEAADEKKEETKWRRMRGAIRDWGESSSCHGIPHMAQASTFCAAIVWSIILAFCAVGFVYFFTDTLSQYLRFDKIVQLNLGLEAENFPSVTFCNINPYKKSKIQMVPALQALMTVYEESSKGTLT